MKVAEEPLELPQEPVKVKRKRMLPENPLISRHWGAPDWGVPNFQKKSLNFSENLQKFSEILGISLIFYKFL